jgi:hypothetical protein
LKNSTLLNEIQASGISLEQSVKALCIVSDVAKQKFPILEGTINSFLKKEFSEVDIDIIAKILSASK